MRERTMERADDEASAKRKRKVASDVEMRGAMRRSAMEILTTDGYAKLRIDDVARRAGIPVRTALRLAPTALDLFRVIVQDRMDAFLSRIAMSVNGRDPLSTLEKILVDCAQFFFDENVIALNRIVISEGYAHPEVAEVFYAEGVERVPVTLAAWLTLQRDLGAIDVVDCGVAARMLVGMVKSDIYSVALIGRDLPSEAEVTSRARLGARWFLNGCAVRA